MHGVAYPKVSSDRKEPLMSSLLHLLHRAGQAADELFADGMSDSDLTPRQFAVLVALGQEKGTSQTGIVGVTGIDRSTLAEIVRRLVARGLVGPRCTRISAASSASVRRACAFSRRNSRAQA